MISVYAEFLAAEILISWLDLDSWKRAENLGWSLERSARFSGILSNLRDGILQISLCLNARSENFTEFSLKVSFKLLESIKCFFGMSSDSKNYFGFLVDEISEPGLTRDKMAISWHLQKLRRKPNTKYSHYEFRLKASFKPVESVWCFFRNVRRS